jgi:glycosyltransferase involved in cell wall biosynthesis
VITLLEPTRAAGFVSGGYRYQAEIGRRLAARGEGRVVAVAPARLAAAVAEHTVAGESIVVDGLFAEHAPLPAGVIALLHTVPIARAWNVTPLPAITTAATTAAAAAVRERTTTIDVVRPGLDAVFVPGPARAPAAPLRVVMAGTVCPAKGQLLVVQALRAHGPPCELTLLGDVAAFPDHVAEVRAAAGALPLSMPGVVEPATVAATLQRSDLFVAASRSESFGMAAAEAAACGVPVLAYDTGEIATFVAHGENGWLVPLDDDDEAAEAGADDGLAWLLGALLADPHRLGAARAARRRPALATWDDVATAFAAACVRVRFPNDQKRTPT